MTDFQDIKIYVGSTDDDRWVAVTASSPFFCFEGHSEDEVVQIATRAVKFYLSLENRIGQIAERGRSRHSPIVQAKRTILAKELVCA